MPKHSLLPLKDAVIVRPNGTDAPGCGALATSAPWIAPIAGLLLAGVWVIAECVGSREISSRAASTSAAALAARIATAIIIAPIAEELAFRGFLARRLSMRAFDELDPLRISGAGIVVSSLAFGLLHQRPVVGTLAGVAYVLIFRRRGRLADAMVTHAVTNASLVIVGALTGVQDLWL